MVSLGLGQDCARVICDIAPFSRECKQLRNPKPVKEFQRMKVGSQQLIEHLLYYQDVFRCGDRVTLKMEPAVLSTQVL